MRIVFVPLWRAARDAAHRGARAGGEV